MLKRKVIIKSWKQMELEYGLNHYGSIDCNDGFTKKMEKEIPESRIIEVDDRGFWRKYCISYCISEDMILGEYIAPGTEIEVSDDKENWAKAYFACYIPISAYPIQSFDAQKRQYSSMHYRLIGEEEKPKPTKQEVFNDAGEVIGWFEPKGGE